MVDSPASSWSLAHPRLDQWAIWLSGMCLVHCLGSAVLLALFASAGVLLHPAIHEVGLGLALVFGVLALGRGMVVHGYMMPVSVGALGLGIMGGALTLPHGGPETVWTLIGVGLLALGHDLNRRADT